MDAAEEAVLEQVLDQEDVECGLVHDVELAEEVESAGPAADGPTGQPDQEAADRRGASGEEAVARAKDIGGSAFAEDIVATVTGWVAGQTRAVTAGSEGKEQTTEVAECVECETAEGGDGTGQTAVDPGSEGAGTADAQEEAEEGGGCVQHQRGEEEPDPLLRTGSG